MTMECRTLRITLVSAENVPDVRNFGRMKVYSETTLNDESDTAKRTTVDKEGETNPKWNICDYTISKTCVHEPRSHMVVRLHCERTLGDEFICGVKISINSLFDAEIKSDDLISYDLPGTGGGKLNIYYGFSDMFLVPKPSSEWKMKAAAAMVRGTWFLLTGEDTGV